MPLATTLRTTPSSDPGAVQPAELAVEQPEHDQEGHDARQRGRQGDAAGAEGLVEHRVERRVQHHPERGDLRGEPGELKAEERPDHQQARAVEGQADREEDERLGGERRALGVELAALEDQPHDRLRQHEQERRGRQEQEEDLPQPPRDGRAHARDVGAGRQPRDGREQHGRDRDAEDALRQQVEAERGVDGPGGLVADQRGEDRVDRQVDVDEPDPERHREHQHQHLANARVAPGRARTGTGPPGRTAGTR